jgi:lipoprotein-anchoring transpeptidase ErfK/SrfK
MSIKSFTFITKISALILIIAFSTSLNLALNLNQERITQAANRQYLLALEKIENEKKIEEEKILTLQQNRVFLTQITNKLEDYKIYLSQNQKFEAVDSINQISALLIDSEQKLTNNDFIQTLEAQTQPQFKYLDISKTNYEAEQKSIAIKAELARIEEANKQIALEEKAREEQRIQNEKIAIEKKLIAEEKARELERLKAEEEKKNKYILVNLKTQTMKAFEDGVEKYSTSITSGRDLSATVTGTFAIYAKETNTYLSGWDDVEKHSYRVHVDYWMPFYQGYGIHDASWRKSFGGEDYHKVGSNGCVNTPIEAVKWFWDFVNTGTKVIVEKGE